MLSATANDDSGYMTVHDQALTESSPGVLNNDTPDTDSEGMPLPMTASLVSGPGNGSVTLNGDGSFVYTPNAGFVGADTFTYNISGSNTATVTINVLNNAPSASDDSSYMVTHDQTLNETAPGVLGNDSGDMDGDPVTAILVDDVTNGTLTFNADGSFVYTPNAGYEGSDSFTYKLNDGLTDSNTATVTINVINNVPVANDDFALVDVGQLSPIFIDVLGNDYDPDSESLTIELLTSSVSDGGAVELDATNLLVKYTPPPSGVTSGPLDGPDVVIEFFYRVKDPAGKRSPTAKVTITLAGKVAGPGIYITQRDLLSGAKGHTSILIVPDNQAFWAGDARFKQAMIGGVMRWYTTISAFQDGLSLKSDLLYGNDAPNKVSVIGTITTSDVENSFIDRFLKYDKNYKDNLTYNANTSSSNSYVRGILEKNGVVPPNLDDGKYSGWDHPVAPENFDP